MVDKKLNRRDFLKVSALTLGGVALASCAPQAAPTQAPTAAAAQPPQRRPPLRKLQFPTGSSGTSTGGPYRCSNPPCWNISNQMTSI